MKKNLIQMLSWVIIITGVALLFLYESNIGILVICCAFIIRKNDYIKYEKNHSNLNQNDKKLEQISYGVYLLFLCFVAALLYITKHPLFNEDKTLLNMFSLLLVSPLIPLFIRNEYCSFVGKQICDEKANNAN